MPDRTLKAAAAAPRDRDALVDRLSQRFISGLRSSARRSRLTTAPSRLGPLAIFIYALRHGAPTPARAGAIAGILAGGIAATFYAAQCTDDSPIVVATWYTIAIAGLALVGAVAADRYARW